METLLKYLGLGLLIVLLVSFILGVSAFVTMWAWNLVMPFLFHLPKISLLQAFGINILIGLIRGVTIRRK